MDRAYERYSLQLRRVQLLYSKSGIPAHSSCITAGKQLDCSWTIMAVPIPGEAWKSARLEPSSVQHILQPLDFTLQLAKCMVEKDTRMPR